MGGFGSSNLMGEIFVMSNLFNLKKFSVMVDCADPLDHQDTEYSRKLG